LFFVLFRPPLRDGFDYPKQYDTFYKSAKKGWYFIGKQVKGVRKPAKKAPVEKWLWDPNSLLNCMYYLLPAHVVQARH
jgi:hypothetical protein